TSSEHAHPTTASPTSDAIQRAPTPASYAHPGEREAEPVPIQANAKRSPTRASSEPAKRSRSKLPPLPTRRQITPARPRPPPPTPPPARRSRRAASSLDGRLALG